MEAKIDKADYAILYGVSLEQWPAWLLLKERTMAGVNRFWPGLAPRELTEHFFRLWIDGLIDCAEGEDEPAIAPDYQLAREQFEFDETVADRPEGNSLTYRLSSQGGDVWAEYAAVDWSRFFSSWHGSGAEEWTLSASLLEPIEIALQIPEIAPRPVRGTAKWEILQPWQATYWKSLSIGHRLSYQYESWARPEFRTAEEFESWQKLMNDIAPYWDGWHKSFQDVSRENNWIID